MQLIPDREAMHASHSEWLAGALQMERAVTAAGHRVERVPVDPDKLASWCIIRGLAPDTQARGEYVADKMSQEKQRS